MIWPNNGSRPPVGHDSHCGQRQRDGVITMIVAHGEDNISMDVFNDPDAGTLEPVHLPHGTVRKD